ncbi:MAG TPA: hypothetical protein VFQ44_27335 [Streptosporangiaceae bacterium]|nr:hypothetical protein [Streptosporangiaceae bacterium]
MSTYWDETTCNITNNTGLALSVSNVPNLSHGEYGTYPTSVPANQSANPSFVARSVNASEIAPVGNLSYGMPDGTSLNIAFDQEFAVLQTSTFTAALSGARAASYGVALSCSWETWHGQGARWTVNLTLSATPGNTSAQCSYTR